MTSTVAPTLTGLTPAEKDAASALVAVIDRCSRMIATIEAMKASALAQLASIAHESGERSANPDGVDYSRRAMAAEVAAATHTHPVAAKHAMEDAEILTQSYPETHAALASGAISVKHARVVMDAGSPLDPLRRSIFDRVAAPIATDMTPGDLARIAKKRSSDMAGLSFDERHEWARRRRYVSVTDLDDGMSMLRVLGPSLELHAVYDRAT
ncbi:MAG TPA: DUF222 domain-containing protein, partial [Microbacterium sp.]|nr:DUF222 domain-containing protein [Microbacterium sp.]